MRLPRVFSMVTCVSAFLTLLLLIDVRAFANESAPVEDVDEPTCSLDPAKASDCSTGAADASEPTTSGGYDLGDDSKRSLRELTRQVVALTDETFDGLTSTPTPATWLIMFKTNSCGICQKARPVLEELSIDAQIVEHNDRELDAIDKWQFEKKESDSKKEVDDTPKGPVYVWEQSSEEGEVPRGPVYIATIDAGWAGRDVTKRFGVDSTPTILVLRNEGYPTADGDSKIADSRSYYLYRGQRATYPLRNFALGGFAVRKRMDMPPPLSDADSKPHSYWGRIYEYVLSPSVKWAGGMMGKILLAWFVFMGCLGLFMRVHNYAWGDDEDDDEKRQAELEKEKAEGREQFDDGLSADEKSAQRQKVMWERKMKNRAKFAASREARKNRKKDASGQGDGGGDVSDEEYEGVGFSVKKSDAQKLLPKDSGKKGAKSKDN